MQRLSTMNLKMIHYTRLQRSRTYQHSRFQCIKFVILLITRVASSFQSHKEQEASLIVSQKYEREPGIISIITNYKNQIEKSNHALILSCLISMYTSTSVKK